MAQGPLAGIRVIDLTQVLAGPTATMLLADLGADVIKVEPPGGGDLSRLARYAKGGINSTVANANRGKRSIQVDLSTEAGRDLGVQLLANCDVAVQNMRPGVMDSLGMGYEHAAAANPEIIYCSMSGYGPTGPYADRAAYDPIIQAVTGYVALQVNPEVPIPDLVRNGLVDKASGWMAALAIVSALFARSRGATGQHIDLSMLDTAVQFLWPDGGMADTLLDDDAREGRRLSTLYRLTPCADGHIVYFVVSNKQFHGLYRALGRPDWVDHPQWGRAPTATSSPVGHPRGPPRPLRGARSPARGVRQEGGGAGAPDARELRPCGEVTAVEDLHDDPQMAPNETLVDGTIRPRAGSASPARRRGSRSPSPSSGPPFPGSTSTRMRSWPSSGSTLMPEDLRRGSSPTGRAADRAPPEQRQTLVEWDHPTAGRIRQPRPAPRFSVTQPEFRPSVPRLNEHADEILAELGFDADAVEDLRRAGAVF